jgi:hypothetical protein
VTRVLVLLLALAAGDEPLRFQGIGMDTDLFSFTKRFPHSQHEFWKGIITIYTDQPLQFTDLIQRGTGNYVGRLTPQESVAHLYYFQAGVANGVWTELLLSFERPLGQGVASPGEHPASRCPPCAPVLADLTREYGKPAAPESTNEEALESLHYTWTRPEGKMSLVCGKYYGDRRVFAERVELMAVR